MFKLNLSVPLAIVTIVMSLFTVFTVVYLQEESIHKNKENISREFLKNLDEKVDIEAAVLANTWILSRQETIFLPLLRSWIKKD